MDNEANLTPGEMLRRAMRRWATGVAIVTSRFGEHSHGMTVNSFGSISLEPPLVTVTMNNDTRTFMLVQQSGVFAVTVLSYPQLPLAELFAGRIDAHGDRLLGLDLFTLQTGAPLIRGGMAYVDCRVVHQYPMLTSTLLVGEVLAATTAGPLSGEEEISAQERLPLIYYNRTFTILD